MCGRGPFRPMESNSNLTTYIGAVTLSIQPSELTTTTCLPPVHAPLGCLAPCLQLRTLQLGPQPRSTPHNDAQPKGIKASQARQRQRQQSLEAGGIARPLAAAATHLRRMLVRRVCASCTAANSVPAAGAWTAQHRHGHHFEDTLDEQSPPPLLSPSALTGPNHTPSILTATICCMAALSSR